MPYIEPMLCKIAPGTFDTKSVTWTPDSDFVIRPGEWAASEKYDGIRLVTEVGGQNQRSLLDDGRSVQAWSRLANDKTKMLPPHILEVLQRFPDCYLDGELMVPGKRSYGTTTIANAKELVYYVFDILRIGTVDSCGCTYDDRQAVLRQMFKKVKPKAHTVHLAESTDIQSTKQLCDLAHGVWKRDGEGLILKRRQSHYYPGKRPKDWLKIKGERSAVLTVIGFRPGTGSIVDTGNFAILVLRDAEGNETTVRVKNYAEREKLEKSDGTSGLGRELRVTYQERTPDGSYRHPRWDRWEDE